MTTAVQEEPCTAIAPPLIRQQLENLVQDRIFRASKRSVQFLRYVVERTLEGEADQIKERTIGIEVFGRNPSYDTNVDHVVRTAAIEVRKRLAIYYGQPEHRQELVMSLVPGSYVPQFSIPETEEQAAGHSHSQPPAVPREEAAPLAAASPRSWLSMALLLTAVAIVVLAATAAAWTRFHPRTAQELFWKPVLDTPGTVLLAVGDAPNGPPTLSAGSSDQSSALPMVHSASSAVVPFADTVTIARVLGTLEVHGKQVVIREERKSSFSELRESPVVLIGAFNNEWSLRLTRRLRYSLALDPDRHLAYIKDSQHPEARTWAWGTNQPTDRQGAAGTPPLQDYALISRIWNSDTGRVVVVVGGLYTYGTEAAGEFLTDPTLMQSVSKAANLGDPHRNVQIVLATTVTDGTPGPPRVLAVSSE
ncbi:hypothetical protein SAMN05421819_4539 [Bryocella elongata]|uniref:Uncharacterized protein n=1 Tax=Bryocella elongata TaxID=863522 RepID=A0A1H6CGK5_9BACT|nr:hypothetical protein [Bryocella elongata]SEG72149.1 hypothetical protein SAMN05421819_4539 [Bryocella elongata]